jgi:hypothetical protein
MRVESESEHLRVFGADGLVCRIDAGDWSACGNAPGDDWSVATAAAGIEESFDTTVSGRASRIRFPPGRVEGRPDEAGSPDTTGNHGTTTEVHGPIRIGTAVRITVAFDGTARVRERPGGIDVAFGERRPVGLGLDASRGRNDRTIDVPESPDGIATALTYASAAHATTTPARSDPATRRHPPLIQPSGETEIPESIRSARTETGIELRVPPDPEPLFVLAPLAYYLGARVSVEPRDSPLLRAPEAGIRRELRSLPELQADAASLLYRTVTLDGLLRSARETSAAARRRLVAAGIDPARVGGMDLDARLAAYLEASFGEIEPGLPEWHLSVYATPGSGEMTALPYALDRLAFVYLPDGRTLPDEERLQRSLADFYRTPGEAPTVDPILPDLHRGRLHGWLAEGVAIDAFKLLPEAYANRRRRPALGGGPTDVTLVINDGEMDAELHAVRTVYREESDDHAVDLRVERRLEREALADTLRRPTDLLHYVGHCDRSGLRCPDGHLDAAGVDHCGARVLFLNACGSYHQGVSLIEAGSTAGAVTLRPVLDEQASRVGAAFARLLTRGFAVERALRIASRRTPMNKDYAVVGDGTYALDGPGDTPRAVVRVTRAGERFRVCVEHGTPGATASRREAVLGEGVCPSGAERNTLATRSELCEFLDGLSLPAVYENRYYWAPELRRTLLAGDLEE